MASTEAASHSKTQVDFIPTMTLGILGDKVMALILGALLIQGIQPGPQLIISHPDIFVEHPISAWFVGASALMILLQIASFFWKKYRRRPAPSTLCTTPPVE